MATRYHINPETGRANQCSATIRCRFGLTQEEHYSSKETARAGYEKSMDSEKIPTPVKKATKVEPPKILTADEKRAAREEQAEALLEEIRAGKFPTTKQKTPFVKTDEELEEESREFEYNYGYSVGEMLDMRNVDASEVYEEEQYPNSHVCVKIPGASEAYISSDLARRALRLPPRAKNEWDNSPVRKISLLSKQADKELYGRMLEQDEHRKISAHQRKLQSANSEAQRAVSDRFPFY